MKRVVVAAALAAGILVCSPTSAGAWATYCDWDPIVPIVTPGGHIVLVYDSVWTASPLSLGLPVATYTTSRVYDAAGATLVRQVSTDVNGAYSFAGLPAGVNYQIEFRDRAGNVVYGFPVTTETAGVAAGFRSTTGERAHFSRT